MFSFRRAAPLRSYPPEAPPWHAGEGVPTLPALLASRARRLQRLAESLARYDIDLPAGLAADGPNTLAETLDAWTIGQWPSIARREWAGPAIFRALTWADGEQASVFTLVVDVGVALGELLLRHRPELAWGVDDYEAHAADGVAAFGRVLVLDPAVSHGSLSPAVCDAIGAAFMRYQSLAFDDGVPGRFIDAMRPLLWNTHRQLFVTDQRYGSHSRPSDDSPR